MSEDDPVVTFLEIEQMVLSVLNPRDLEKWWFTAIPALSGLTPWLLFQRGDGDVVLDYVKTYRDPSFS